MQGCCLARGMQSKAHYAIWPLVAIALLEYVPGLEWGCHAYPSSSELTFADSRLGVRMAGRFPSGCESIRDVQSMLRMQAKDIQLREDSQVVELRHRQLHLKGQQQPQDFDACLWCTQASAPAWLRDSSLGLPLGMALSEARVNHPVLGLVRQMCCQCGCMLLACPTLHGKTMQ